MKCPSCWSEVIIPRIGRGYMSTEDMERSIRNEKWGGITCDGCPAILTVSYEGSDLFWLAGIFSLVLAIAVPFIMYVFFDARLELIVGGSALFAVMMIGSFAGGYSRRTLEVTGMRPSCPSCGTIAENKDIRFCPRCGSTFTGETPSIQLGAKRAEVPVTERVGICMVCNLGLRTGDLLARCPHCGSAAHREHLLEWVHVKKRCPACSEHIDEREITKQPVEGSTPKKRKKPWRTA